MRKVAWFILIIIVFTSLSGCIVSHPRISPPPPKKEIVPPNPGPSYMWIPGHWKWKGNHYVWERGYWTKKRPGMVWIPGHWKKKGPRWVWIPGHWKKRQVSFLISILYA